MIMSALTLLDNQEPIVTLVDGLLHGEHTVSQALLKGNLGLGTLDMLDGEVRTVEPWTREREGLHWDHKV